ncbi:MAG TPA: hypothetical protein VM869_20435 [Enhygromyxa sp.]|nr:hypothetical protein [Enhygromyxa sp.]
MAGESEQLDDLPRFRDRFHIFLGINRTAEARRQHAAALRAMAGEARSCSELTLLDEHLELLDAKADALVGFNSILLTVQAIYVSWVQEIERPAFEWLELLLCLGLLLCIVSCTLCLSIHYVFWARTETLQKRSWEAYSVQLLWLRDRRTIIYRISWWLAVAALGCLGLVVVAQIVHGALTS